MHTAGAGTEASLLASACALPRHNIVQDTARHLSSSTKTATVMSDWCWD
jgi:hypothetical protein